MGADSTLPVIVILAGGTGGHVYPALAVATELRERGYQVHWFGTARGLEARVVPAADFPLHTLTVRGLRGKGVFAKLLGLMALMIALLQALRLLWQLRPGCVLGLGGYVAGPGGIAAWLLRRPLLIHEQNSVAGTTNRALVRFADRIMSAYPQPFPDGVESLQVGNPVRRELLDQARQTHYNYVYNYTNDRPLQLLVVGGSLGALAINDVVPAALQPLLQQGGLVVRHQTGTAHSDVVNEAYGKVQGTGVEVLAYIEDMAAAFAWADLVLCRAGALTIAELTVMARPALLVPLPGAIDNHQAINAQWLREQGGALLLPQAELTVARLTELLQELINDPSRLAAMASAAAAAAIPDATQRVADLCVEACCES